MFKHEKELFHPVAVERPNPQYAALLQEQLGGANGELKAAMQYKVSVFLPFVGTQLAGLGDSGAVLCIQSDDLIHQRQLLILELLLDVFLDDLGIFADKLNV